MKEIVKLSLILFTITVVAGLLLGVAYETTKEPIARQLEKEKNQAMQQIITKADRFEEVSLEGQNGNIKEVYGAYHSEEILGYALKVEPKGYAGTIEIMVGISGKGKVEGIQILSHSETPGLGANAQNESFTMQFKDKSLKDGLKVIKGKATQENEIEALTGATITSRAVTEGVKEAIDFYHRVLEGNGGEAK